MTLKKKSDTPASEEPTIDDIVGVISADEPISSVPVGPSGIEDVPSPPSSGVDPWAVMDRLTRALESLSSRPAEGGQNSKAIEVLTDAVTRLADASIKGSQLVVDESKRAFRPSNQVIPEISVFNRRGRAPQANEAGVVEGPVKPPLKCLMMIPWVAEWESLTREEVELLNLLEEGAYVIRRQDRTKVTMTVQMRYAEDNVTPSALFINHETAFNQDNFRNMPPLSDMLRDMLKQHDRPIAQRAAAVLTDEEEEALIEAGELTVTV